MLIGDVRIGDRATVWFGAVLRADFDRIEVGSESSIQDLSSLKGLVTLTSLDLSKTNIRDLDALKGLINLRELDLSANPVKDLEPLKGLTNLRKLSVLNTEVTTAEPLNELPLVSILGLPSPRGQNKP